MQICTRDFRAETPYILNVTKAVMDLVQGDPDLVDVQFLPPNPNDLEGEEPINIIQWATYSQYVNHLGLFFSWKTQELLSDSDSHVLVTYTKYKIPLLKIRLDKRLMHVLGITNLDTFKVHVSLHVDRIITTSLNPENVKNMILDALTDMYNRPKFDALLSSELQRVYSLKDSQDESWGFVLLFDIDFFKTINDLLWHRLWDDVLRYVVQLVKGFAGSMWLKYDVDIFCGRRGGEEFGVYIRGISESDLHTAFHKYVSSGLRAFVESKIIEKSGISHTTEDDSNTVTKMAIDGLISQSKEKIMGQSRQEMISTKLEPQLWTIFTSSKTKARKANILNWINLLTYDELKDATSPEDLYDKYRSQSTDTQSSQVSEKREENLRKALVIFLNALMWEIREKEKHFNNLRITWHISAGAMYYGWQDKPDMAEMLELIDKCLYEAKSSWRNSVHIHQQSIMTTN